MGTGERPPEAPSVSNQGCEQGHGGGSAPASARSPAQSLEDLEASRGCLFGMGLDCPMADSGRVVQASPGAVDLGTRESEEEDKQG